MTPIACKKIGLCVCLVLEIPPRISYGEDRCGNLVRNLTAKCLFKSYEKLDRIKAVSAQVLDEASIVDDLLRRNVKMPADYVPNPMANAIHGSDLTSATEDYRTISKTR
ncbi:hypothetical protein ACVIJ6_007623 [Bradyrhizobium sp. USDA 4369]